MKGWRSASENLRKKTGLEWLHFHDLRHTSITKLAESGLGDQVIMDIAGHVSPTMLRHHSHIRLASKREIVEVLENLPTISERAREMDAETPLN
jgi:integrase